MTVRHVRVRISFPILFQCLWNVHMLFPSFFLPSFIYPPWIAHFPVYPLYRGTAILFVLIHFFIPLFLLRSTIMVLQYGHGICEPSLLQIPGKKAGYLFRLPAWMCRWRAAGYLVFGKIIPIQSSGLGLLGFFFPFSSLLIGAALR